jgi:hypothetical protein
MASLALPSRARHPVLRRYLTHPWGARARRSPAVRDWLDKHGYITPHFTWTSYACTDGTQVPHDLRPNAIRLHWKLERMRHAMGDVSMNVDGPFRTHEHNVAVGGASDSRHVHADAADFFRPQVLRWVALSKRLHSVNDVLDIADRIFADGGLGNENSGTLHVDARGHKARFVTWAPARG